MADSAVAEVQVKEKAVRRFSIEGQKFPSYRLERVSSEASSRSNSVNLGGKDQEGKKVLLLTMPLGLDSLNEDSANGRKAKKLIADFSRHQEDFSEAGFQFYALSARGTSFGKKFLDAADAAAFPLLSDLHLEVASKLGIPLYNIGVDHNADYYPMAMVLFSGVVSKVFYPLPEDSEAAAELVSDYLQPWAKK